MKIVAAGLIFGGILFAQNAPSSSSPSSSSKNHGSKPRTHAKTQAANTAAATNKSSTSEWRKQCSKSSGFCIEVPKDWKSLGEVYEGAGFVVAEPNAAKPQEDWNQITAAATDMPESANGQERPTTDELIDLILGTPTNGIHAETIERAKTMIAGMPTETLKIRLRSKDSGTDAIEFIALLDDDETIYSVALGCSPEDAARLQPVFERVLHSWKATPPAPVPNSTPPSAAPQGSAAPPDPPETPKLAE